MIIEKHGNILDADEEIICHQVNCKGTMGAGLALQIKKKWPQAYKSYKDACLATNSKRLLGLAQLVKCDGGKIIANVFGQNGYGTEKVHTDYDALQNGLRDVFEAVKYNPRYQGYRISIPYKIGCGLAGGNWDIVYKLIDDLSKYYQVDVIMYKI